MEKVAPNKNHYALIIVLIDEMNKERNEHQKEMYKVQFLKDLKLLSALLKIANLCPLEDSLDDVKRICISKSNKDDVDNNFKHYPIHTNREKECMLKWIENNVQ